MNKLLECFMRAALPFYMAQLETRHGQPTSSLHWMMECREILAFADMRLVTVPVKREFDRRAAFAQAMRECESWREIGRERAQSLYYRARRRLQHLLDERDTRAFFAYAAQALELLLMHDSAGGRGSEIARKPAKKRRKDAGAPE